MTQFYLFSDNKGGDAVVLASFKSARSAEIFLTQFENHGGIKQFSYDLYGSDKKKFIDWAERNYPGRFLVRKPFGAKKATPLIVELEGYALYAYMKGIFKVM